LFAIFASPSCVEQKALLIPKEELCLPDSAFSIAKVTRTSTKSDVIRLKGEPIRTISDDTLLFENLVYEDMTVIISGDEVLSVSTSSPKYKIRPGIHCGMPREAAMKLLGLRRYKKEISELQIGNCATIDHIGITFNDKNVITSIDMGIDLPLEQSRLKAVYRNSVSCAVFGPIC
jgi:hypothetical protein